MEQTKINISEFISVAIVLSYHSTKIMQTVYESLQKEDIKTKSDNSVVTKADIQIQQMIIEGLKFQFQGLKFVGEETTTCDDKYQLDYSKINRNLVSSEIFKDVFINTNEATIFIDPLDGTQYFVDGDLEAVTILIGVVLNKKPFCGIVTRAFDKEYKTSFHFGGSFLDKISYFYSLGDIEGLDLANEAKEPRIQTLKKPQQGEMILITSKNKYPAMKEQIEKLNPKKVLCDVGGTGNKLLYLSEGKGHIFCNISKNTGRWDICASEAILLGYGGKLVDIYGNPYEYNDEGADQKNSRGLVAGIDEEYLNSVLDISKNLKI